MKTPQHSSNRHGYALYLVVVMLGCALLVGLHLSRLSSQLNFRSAGFLHNRQAYYLLLGTSKLAFNDILSQANSSDTDAFRLFRSPDLEPIPFKLSPDVFLTAGTLAAAAGCTSPDIVMQLSDIRRGSGLVYDSREFTGRIRLTLTTICGKRRFQLTLTRQVTLSNVLLPIGGGFALFTPIEDQEINKCRFPGKTVTVSDPGGIIYLGPGRKRIRLTAGAEEFLLPMPKKVLSGDKALVTEYFAFSQAYAEFFPELQDLRSSFLNICGTSTVRSQPVFLGDFRKNYLALSAEYRVVNGELVSHQIITEHEDQALSPHGAESPFFSAGVCPPSVVYDQERDLLHIVNPDKRLFWRSRAGEIPWANILLQRVHETCYSELDFKRFCSRKVQDSALDPGGRTVLVNFPLTLSNITAVSPGIIVCTKGAMLKNIRSEFPLCIAVLSGDLTLSGAVDASVCQFDPYGRVTVTDRLQCKGFLSGSLSSDSFPEGGTISLYPEGLDYFNPRNYHTIFSAITGEVHFAAAQ
ncbi:MAG: hypothetical protein PHQ23_00380 [Candidatus Wallbacteria bacterium]|nr:hypothetical protein [Candidatus Wallbacteria bacterium]